MQTMTEPTTMYAGDGSPNELEGLRHAIEVGRRHKIAAGVLDEFLDGHREEIVRNLEAGTIAVENLADALAELRVMKAFRGVTKSMIQLGEIAEERMNEIGG